MTTILADKGTSATGRLDYSVVSEPATVHDLLLQKSDGTFELVVWDEKPAGGSDDVVVDLGAQLAAGLLVDDHEHDRQRGQHHGDHPCHQPPAQA